MSHYFELDEHLADDIRDVKALINGENLTFRTNSGVFSNKEVDKGSLVFIKTLIALNIKGTILDLGCGYGVVGISLAKFLDEVKVTYSDINPRCVELTSYNLKRYDLDGKCLQSDGYLNIDERFDYIVFNPPISVGKNKIYSIYEESKKHLNEKGKLYLVIRKDKGAISHMNYLSSIGYACKIINKEKGYFVIECL